MRLRASVHRERWTPDQEHVADRPVTKHQHYHQAAYVMLTVPHEEEWVSGNPRAVWVELK